MTKLETMIDQAGKIVILGHVNPDGDCAGSCLAVYNYIKEWDSTKAVTVRLERAPSKFSYLSGFDAIDESRISKHVAECIYTGIIHDTGVFKYSNTSRKTMEIAGKMMEKGIDFGTIIDGSFYKKTYMQSQILGRALLESITFLDGRCIFSVVRKKDMDFYGVDKSDLDGIVGPQQYKVSLRSQKIVDVSQVAAYFGGGGHVRAAGCTMSGSVHDVVNNLSAHIAEQLEQEKANA